MQIGCQQFCIDPPFPVNRMLREEKHQAVSGHLYCRIAALYPENDLPFYHVSIDTVELWKDREDRIPQVITEALGRAIHCICASTHSLNCPCMTTDDAYVDYVLDVIRQGVAEIPLHTYREVQYQYQYRYFDKVGKSRVMDYVTPHLYAETLSLYGDGRRVLTFLMHNVHPTTKELWVGNFTAEYPGYCIEQLRQEYPGEFFTFLLGPAGDTSPHFVRKDRSYEEMIRLAELLRQEFDAQLKTQCPEARKPVHLRFEHTTFPKDLVPVERSRVEIPARPNADEQKVLARLDGKGVRCVVDATRALLANVLPFHPFLIKPNNHELGELVGRELTGDAEITAAARTLQEKGARNVLVSMAGDGALLVDEAGGVHRIGCPKGKVVNSVGAGDSMVAGFVAGYLQSGSYEQALRLGTACGSATAFSLGLATKEKIEELFGQI